jgi:hypothetical protein
VESWANIREDEADYFVQQGTPFSWNYFETNVKDDFEERWGDASGYSLSEIVITFEIVVGYPAMNTEYANWDEVSLRTVQMTVTGTQTTSMTSRVSSTPSTRTRPTSAITGTTATTRSTETQILIRPEITVGIIVVILIVAIAAFLGIRRRRPRLPASARYCINCGAAMPLTAKYCPKCGSGQ